MAGTPVRNVTGKMYEKVINLKFYKRYESLDPDLEIYTPTHGFKPKIEVAGSIIPGNFYTNFQLRITNMLIPITEYYEKVIFDAGYENDISTGPISGRIMQAYVETPGPDGVMVFICLMSSTADWPNHIYRNPVSGEPIYRYFNQASYKDILQDFLNSVSALMKIPKYTILIDSTSPDSIGNKIMEQGQIEKAGSVSDVFQFIINTMGIKAQVWSNTISFFTAQIGNSVRIFKIDRFLGTPRVNVGGHINFQSVWIPNIMPGDYVYIDSEFSKLTFGAYLGISSGDDKPTVYNVLKVDFDFSTTENTNVMVVDCIAPERYPESAAALIKSYQENN